MTAIADAAKIAPRADADAKARYTTPYQLAQYARQGLPTYRRTKTGHQSR